jgi:acyl dehydratase
MADIAEEAVKEILFGGLAGMAAGYVTKKTGNQLLGLSLGAGFVAFRAAVFNGDYLATWSPLLKDDTSFPQHLKRKARKETFSTNKRVEDFTKENFLIFGGFSGFFLFGKTIP